MIATKASDKRDGDKSVLPEHGASVVDTVSYAHLVPDTPYVLEGTLVDRETGLPLEANGGTCAPPSSSRPKSPGKRGRLLRVRRVEPRRQHPRGV